MHKKLLASDWDGTLFHKEHKDGVIYPIIKKEDIDAIREFRRQGHYFALCTGRTPNSIRHALLDFPDLEIDGLILASGGAIYQATRQHPIEIQENISFWIPSKDAVEFIRYFHDTGKFSIYWSTQKHCYGLLECNPASERSHALKLISLEDWCSSPVDVLSFGLSPISRSEKDAINALETISQKWGKSMTGFRNMTFVDVSANGVDKGTGIQQLSQLLNHEYHYYAIGDAQNDIPMFEKVGKNRSFRMAKGVAELDSVASRAVGSVAECIEQLLQEHSV
ncbi:MAG: HAD-IIB family hydrolase [Brevinema sp.]